MDIPLTILEKMLADAAERGATIALRKAGNIKPYMNKTEAYRLYGRTNVENWIRKGLITPKKDGLNPSAQVRIDRIEIETIADQSNRQGWYVRNEKPRR